MSRYRVSFYNDLPDSTGHDHCACQREIIVVDVEGKDAAIAHAIKLFEREEQVSHWSLHARRIDCEHIAPDQR